MTIDEIKKLIEVVRETGISELEVQWGENRVKIRGVASATQELVMPTVMPVPISPVTAPPFVAAPPASIPPAPPSPEPAAPSAESLEESRETLVKSPIVGTYYDAPSPGTPPFVKVGDRVSPKQVLCIIESMKLMNEIEAEIAGVVVAKHVDNGRPVEYGEALFTIRPTA
jgi:acetyl-CoA carboxylase biotin carboxyl carrier protein